MKNLFIYATKADLQQMPANSIHVYKMWEQFNANVDISSILVAAKLPLEKKINNAMLMKLPITWLPISCKLIIARIRKVRYWIHFRDNLPYCIAIGIVFGHSSIEFHSPRKFSDIQKKCLRYLMSKKKLFIYATSQNLADWIENELGLANINVLPNGLDDKSFSNTFNGFNQRLKFGLVASQRAGKGQETMQYLAKKYPEYEFKLIGKKLKSLNFSTNVTETGQIPFDQVQRELQDIDICLAFISKKMEVAGGRIEDGEYSCPLKMGEYLTARKPILISNRKTLRELYGSLSLVKCLNDNLDNFDECVSQITNATKATMTEYLKEIDDLHKNQSWSKRAQILTIQMTNG